MKELIALAQACGFNAAAELKPENIELREEVRQTCASGCRIYGKSWACPPACGDLESCRCKIADYKRGILVQTVAQLEDEFDGEGMMEAEHKHKENFMRLQDQLQEKYPNLLAMGTGSCPRCEKCSYPDAPCRFPKKMISSMEAYGMLVSQVCKDNGLPYYYGRTTIAYTSCFLLD